MPRIIAFDLAPHTGDQVLANGLKLAAKFRADGLPVILVRVDRPNVTEQPPGSGFAEGLVQPGDVTIVKGTIGAFHNTGLHEELQRLGVSTLVIGGLITTMGVDSTARAASDLGYELEYVEDAMSGPDAVEHNVAVSTTFPRFGKVRSTESYL